MAEIINTYIQDVPAMRFIGRTYSDADRVNGGYGHLWHEWMQNEWLNQLDALITPAIKAANPDMDASLGLMSVGEGQPFLYRIGYFVPAGTPVPDGFEFLDFPAQRFGVVWLKGTPPDIFGKEMQCWERLAAAGHRMKKDRLGREWFMERYQCPRFTQPDANGQNILDICFVIE